MIAVSQNIVPGIPLLPALQDQASADGTATDENAFLQVFVLANGAPVAVDATETKDMPGRVALALAPATGEEDASTDDMDLIADPAQVDGANRYPMVHVLALLPLPPTVAPPPPPARSGSTTAVGLPSPQGTTPDPANAMPDVPAAGGGDILPTDFGTEPAAPVATRAGVTLSLPAALRTGSGTADRPVAMRMTDAIDPEIAPTGPVLAATASLSAPADAPGRAIGTSSAPLVAMQQSPAVDPKSNASPFTAPQEASAIPDRGVPAAPWGIQPAPSVPQTSPARINPEAAQPAPDVTAVVTALGASISTVEAALRQKWSDDGLPMPKRPDAPTAAVDNAPDAAVIAGPITVTVAAPLSVMPALADPDLPAGPSKGGTKARAATALAQPLPTPAPDMSGKTTPMTDLLPQTGDTVTSDAALTMLADAVTNSATPLANANSLSGGSPPPASPLPANASPTIVTMAKLRDDGPLDLTLSPDELGRLTISIKQEGAFVQVTLTADRPETLDLMRRHGNDLIADLRQAGFAGASLSFGSGGQSQQPRPAEVFHDAKDMAHSTPATPEINPAMPRHTQNGSGLDIRF